MKNMNKEERIERYKFIETKEIELLGIPRPDGVILHFMPVESAKEIRRKKIQEKFNRLRKKDIE